MIIEFGEYQPDAPALGNQVITAKNVIPAVKGYKQFLGLDAFSSALTAYCRGAFTATDTAGNVKSFAGDETKLYRIVGSTFNDSSKSGGYSSGTDSYWEFVKYGDVCLATNFDDTIQTLTLTSGTQFADLTGTPPRARHISVVRDFLVVGNTFDASDGAVPHRVRWPGIGTTTSWTVSASTQADFNDLPGNGGWVQSIVGGEVGYVFLEREIWRMTYVGSPVVFQFDRIEDARGAFAPQSTILVGGAVFYIADDGFYVLVGNQSIPIGAGKVDKTFLADLDDSFIHRVTAAAFPDDKVVAWSYPGTGSTDGTPNKIIMYNWVSKKWAFAEFDHELLYRAQSVGVTLDDLDNLYNSLSDIPFSLDAKAWMGGKLQMAAFDTDHKQAFFSGSALTATIDTGEANLIPGKRAEVTEVVPLIDGGTHTVQMGTRETQAGTVSFGSAVSENTSGICPVRSNARYHRARVNVSGGFTDAIGILVPDEAIHDVGAR